MTPARRHRAALFALFLLPGLIISSWVTRTPVIRDMLGASTQQMGFVLLGLSAGSMLGVLISGTMVGRFGARPVAAVGLAGIVLSMPSIGLGAYLGFGALVAFGLTSAPFRTGCSSDRPAGAMDELGNRRLAHVCAAPSRPNA
jgi:MFS family permease